MIGIKKIEVWLEVLNIRIMIGQIRFEFFMIEDNLEYLGRSCWKKIQKRRNVLPQRSFVRKENFDQSKVNNETKWL